MYTCPYSQIGHCIYIITCNITLDPSVFGNWIESPYIFIELAFLDWLIQVRRDLNQTLIYIINRYRIEKSNRQVNIGKALIRMREGVRIDVINLSLGGEADPKEARVSFLWPYMRLDSYYVEKRLIIIVYISFVHKI